MTEMRITTDRGAAFQDMLHNVSVLIEQSQSEIRKVVNSSMVITYYCVGYFIVIFEQNGENRAAYGKEALKNLSAILKDKYGRGWSVEQLTLCRKFYRTFCPNLVNTVYEIQKASDTIPIPKFGNLSWSHYLVLMRIEQLDERSFYEIECERQGWSVRQLQRQVGSSLYERLALSRDKEEVMRLAREGQTIDKPTDILKNPLTLEFLGIQTHSVYSESDLEKAIISRISEFLLEMGRGFLFEARQKRLSFEEDHYYVDLVFYNRLLQCYVLIDLKTDKLKHQDIGQMQMYVNYYDRFVKQAFEKPTIGILLCRQKNDALVELTLPADANIYAQQYALCLPDKKLLQRKLKEWIAEFEDAKHETDL